MSRNNDAVYNTIYEPFMNRRSANRKTSTRLMYQRVLTELAVNRFKWVGLPDTIDTRFLELELFYRGLAVFYFDHKYDRFLALRGSGAGTVNMYDNPTEFLVTGNQMINKRLKGNECVPIWANYLRRPDLDIVMVYADKLAEIDRTIDIDLVHLRKPFIVAASETRRLTLMNTMRNLADGDIAIFGTDDFDPNDSITVFNTGISDNLVPNLVTTKQKIWNEAMTMLGINNANQDKKERLVAEEVGANDSQVAATRGVGMRSRQDACDLINRMYGLNVEVQWNIDESMTPDMPSMDGVVGSDDVEDDSE